MISASKWQALYLLMATLHACCRTVHHVDVAMVTATQLTFQQLHITRH